MVCSLIFPTLPDHHLRLVTPDDLFRHPWQGMHSRLTGLFMTLSNKRGTVLGALPCPLPLKP